MNQLAARRNSSASQGQDRDREIYASEPLIGIGRLLYSQILPQAIQQALRQLPSDASFILITNENQLPWELLHDGEDYLALKQNVARQIIVEDGPPHSAIDDVSGRQWKALLIGNPSSDLPEAAKEIEQLANMIESIPEAAIPQIIMHRRATRRTILHHLSSGVYDLIHYSGHTHYDAQNPEASGLLLAQGEILTADDIVQHLNGRPVVFLNGCRSASLHDQEVNTILNLAKAFIQGGARSFVGSYWPIYDTGSRHFSLSWYRMILQGETLGRAMRLARLESKESNPQLPLWASYTYYGNPDLQFWHRQTSPKQPATVFVLRLLGLNRLISTINGSIEKIGAIPMKQEIAENESGWVDEDDAYALIESQFARVANQITRFGGQIQSVIQDTLIGTFGLPTTQQNDVERALLAAQAILGNLNQDQADSMELAAQSEIDVAIGVSSGDLFLAELETQNGPYQTIMGHAITQAILLSKQAQQGDLLVTDSVRRLARPFFDIELETVELETAELELLVEPQPVHRILELRERTSPNWSMNERSVEFVGRKFEQEILQRAWQQSQRGRGQIVDIIGEAGVGKSRLLYESRQKIIAESTNHESIRWISIACPSAYAPGPYWLIGELLRTIFEMNILKVDRREYEALTPQTLHGVAQQILGVNRSQQELMENQAILMEVIFGSTSLEQTTEVMLEQMGPHIRQRRLITLLGRLLAHLTTQAPLVIALEDLHWADDESLDILNQLWTGTEQAAILVICLWRATTSGNQSPWQQRRNAQQIRLASLDEQESRQLLISLLQNHESESDEIEEEIAQVLLPSANGNPFLLCELITSLLESNLLVYTHPERFCPVTVPKDVVQNPSGDLYEQSKWRLTRSLHPDDIPGTVRRVVKTRAESLPAAAQAILPLMSVIGDQLALSLLQAVVAGLDLESHLDKGLYQLEERAFIEHRWGDDLYHFTHSLLRSEIYSDLQSEQRRRYHRRVGQAMLQLFHSPTKAHTSSAGQKSKMTQSLTEWGAAGREGELQDLLAHHFYQSVVTPGALGGPQKVLEGAAPDHLLQAAEHLARAGAQANRHYAARQAVIHYDRALQTLKPLTEVSPEQIAACHEGLGKAHNILGNFEQAIHEYETAVSTILQQPLTDTQNLRIADLKRRLGRLCGRLSQFEQGHRHMQRALELLKTATDAEAYETAALIHTHTGSLYYLQDQMRLAEESCQQALNYLDVEVPGRVLATAANVLGAVYMATGRLEEAVLWFQRSADIWTQLGDQYHLAQVTDNLGTLHFHRGEFDLAEATTSNLDFGESWKQRTKWDTHF
ncbi:CHAT domain-containing protein [Chloroflexi bacterium TSY]|nr:CHAT domain-containing protein [Chloroflexi bacterium TSY]